MKNLKLKSHFLRIYNFVLKNQKRLKSYGIQIGLKGTALILGLIPQRFINHENIALQDRASLELILPINAILFSFLDLGLTNLLYKAYTLEKDENKLAKIWTLAFCIRFGMYFVGIIIFLMLIQFNWLRLGGLDKFLIFGIYTSQYLLIFDGSYKAISDTRGTSFKFTLSDLICKLFIAGFLILLPIINKGYINIYTYIIVNIIMYILINIFDYYLQKDFIKWSIPSFGIIKKDYKTILVLIFTALVGTIYTKIPVYFVEKQSDIVSFGIASKTYELLMIVPALIIPIISSEFVQKYNVQNSSFEKTKILKKYLFFSFLMGIFCFILCMMLSYPVLYLTKGLRFENALLFSILYSINFLVYPSLYFIGNTNFLFNFNKFLILNVLILFLVSFPVYFIFYNTMGLIGLIISILVINIIDVIVKMTYLKTQKRL
jgi:O-antigen/teichoic acid export membrane protein